MKANIKKIHLFSIDPKIDTTTISTNFKNSFSNVVNKVLVLIVTHILITQFLSKGSPIAFGACDFIISLNMFAYKSTMLTFKGFATYKSEGLTFYVSQ
jgi:hypothetical protein